jgi:hypothetical protein
MIAVIGSALPAAAAPVTYRCPNGWSYVIDVAKHKLRVIDPDAGDITSTQGGIRFEGHYVTYGVGMVQPVTIDTTTGHLTAFSTGLGQRIDEGEVCPPSR